MTDNYLDNTQAPLELMGIPNILTPFSQFNSASRVSMFNHHLAQSMVLDQPEFNKLFTGVENKLIPHVFNNSEREFPCEILAVIPKYIPNSSGFKMEDCPQIYVIVMTIEPNGVRHLDYFTIDRYFMGNNGFGYIPHLENLHRINVGDYLEPETVITRSPAVQGNKYCMSTNLNIAYGSFPETIEDAFVISESAAKKLQTTQVSKIVLNCRQDRRPLNVNGDQYVDKFLPDIGSYVNEDGILCAFRPVHWTTIMADTSPEALREPLPLQDDIYYIEPGSKIIDLTFNVNNDKINNCYDQALLYMRNNTKCWEGIYQKYLQYKGKCDGLTPKMSTLVSNAIYRMIAQGARVPLLENSIRKEMRNFDIEGVGRSTVDFLQVEITYTVPRTVHNGDKLTDSAGAKGVVGRIYPDDWMPVDEHGIRAEMMIDMNSPVSRNNPGQLYETGINRISEFARRAIKETFETKGTEDAFAQLMDFYGDVNPNYSKLITQSCVDLSDKKGVVKDAIETSPKIWIPPFIYSLTPKKEDVWHALRNIQTWAKKWGCVPGRIKYKIMQADGTGKEFTTDQVFSIGSKAIYHLHKIPEITAPGPAAVNHIGVPTKSTYETKYYPVSTNPYRFGEDELRLMCMDADPREVTRFQNLQANSPQGVSLAIKTILTSEHPTRVGRMPIHNGDLARSSSILRVFHNTTAVLGVDTKDTKTEAFDVADELAESIYETVGEFGKRSVNMFGNDDDGSISEKKASSKRTRNKKMMEIIEAIEPSDELPPPIEDEDETEDSDG